MILFSESQQCVSVCSFYNSVCVGVFAHTVHISVNLQHDPISTVQESSTHSCSVAAANTIIFFPG